MSKRTLRQEVDDLRTVVAVQGTVISSLIGALGPEVGATMGEILAELRQQNAYQALSARERRIFDRELEIIDARFKPVPDLH